MNNMHGESIVNADYSPRRKHLLELLSLRRIFCIFSQCKLRPLVAVRFLRRYFVVILFYFTHDAGQRQRRCSAVAVGADLFRWERSSQINPCVIFIKVKLETAYCVS